MIGTNSEVNKPKTSHAASAVNVSEELTIMREDHGGSFNLLGNTNLIDCCGLLTAGEDGAGLRRDIRRVVYIRYESLPSSFACAAMPSLLYHLFFFRIH